MKTNEIRKIAETIISYDERLSVDDEITVTKENLKAVMDGNRSIKVYPSDSYVAKYKKYLNKKGKITHIFSNGYEATVEFEDGQAFHVKSNFVTKT